MNRETQKVYLDYAATTPVDPVVEEAMRPYFGEKFGNPSSVHSWGQETQAAVDEAREEIAKFLGCNWDEVVFTGSATEANNLAIRGVAKATSRQARRIHLITTQIEHESVLETCKDLEREGVEVTYLPVTNEGLVRLEDIAAAIRPETVLVSIMYANNEIGTIQPIAEIGKLLAKQDHKIYFHTDAVQAVQYLESRVERLHVDLLTISGHKIYGPKGIGALYVRRRTPLAPLLTGGGQESGRRSSTENVPYIVGFAEAVKRVHEFNELNEGKRVTELQGWLIDEILTKVPGTSLNGSREHRLPNNVNVSFDGLTSEDLLIALDQQGIAVSAGSACASKAVETSHVFRALGMSDEQASSSLRISLGRPTTKSELEHFVEVLRKEVTRLRSVERKETIVPELVEGPSTRLRQ